MDDFEYWNIDNLDKTIDLQLNLDSNANEMLEMKQEVDKQLDFGDRKSMIRYLYTIVDCSSSTKLKDLKPSRLACTFDLLKNFIDTFYDKNPLSHLGFGVMKDAKLQQLSDLAQYSRQHHEKLTEMKESDSNEISLKNALDVATDLLKMTPLYACKEVLIILSANSSCDPGDINDTIEELQKFKIKVSIITLSCKMFLCKRIAEMTNGNHELVTSKENFRDILIKYANPAALNIDAIQITLVPIGFPSKTTDEMELKDKKDKLQQTQIKTLCCCHESKYESQHYICPRCKARNCDIPSTCGICGLNLISASLLARPDPVPMFDLYQIFQTEKEIKKPSSESQKALGKLLHLETLKTTQVSCSGCDASFDSLYNKTDGDQLQQSQRYQPKQSLFISQCPKCQKFYCLQARIQVQQEAYEQTIGFRRCDIYVHDSLFNCPTCS